MNTGLSLSAIWFVTIVPNHFLATDDPLFDKWGRPTIITSDHINRECRYKCGNCEASWVGPFGDYCEWCHKRWLMVQAENKRKLLFPEWIDWGEQYYQLGKVSREVWANTRGYSGNFISPWLARIEKAQTNGEISEVEFVAAFKRCTQWINRMP